MVTRPAHKVLRINLTTGEIGREETGGKVVEALLGGRALGAMRLYDELKPGIDPLGPDNKLMFSVGPMAGTSAPGNSRYCVQTKSPLTGLYLQSFAGGYFGAELKRTGIDSVVIEGRAEKPVYILMSDDGVQLRDASHLWGLTTDHTQEVIKDELGDKDVRMACIGPAGERLVPYACVVNETRTAGRGGSGAVMGSKNLKAIAAKGTTGTEIADQSSYKRALKRAGEDLRKSPLTKNGFLLNGSMGPMILWAIMGIQPWRNWQEASSPNAEQLFPDVRRDKFLVRDIRCAPPCPVTCGKLVSVRDGPHAGAYCEGPEYETAYCFGSCLDIADLAAVIEANELCDRYGLDSISTGVSIAFAMECYEKGIISRSDTGGDEIRFGDSRLLPKLIRGIAYREGFGEILSRGTRKMSEEFGRDSHSFAMHCKGMEMGGYDPRGAKGMALVYACGPVGGCHKGGGFSIFREVDGGDSRFSNEGKAALVKQTRERRVFMDSAASCTFVSEGLSDVVLAEILTGVVGREISLDYLFLVGERGSNIERAFNVREGLRRSWDTLPPRLLKESPTMGSTKGQVVDLEPLVTDFYKVCGWDVKTGIPTREKLIELGLPEIAEDMAHL